MSSARAVSDTFQPCSLSLASRNVRSESCLKEDPRPTRSPGCRQEPLDIHRRHRLARRQNQRPFDGIPELTDVAGPCSLLEPGYGVLMELPERHTGGDAQLLREEPDQRVDVLDSFPKRWDLDLHDVQPVEKVLPKPFADLGRQVLVGCGDDPHVYRDRLGTPDARHQAFLEHAKHLCLRRERHVPDLIEKQGSAVGQLELARPVRDGTREGALHMTEELALDELCGDRGTVDFDEGA